MKRLLSNCSTSNFLRIGNPWIMCRLKYDFANSEHSNYKFPSADIHRNLNKYLFSKISNAKDEESKSKIIKTIIKINRESKLDFLTIDLLMKSKVRNYAVKSNDINNRNSNVPQQTISETKENETEKKSHTSVIPRLIRREPGEVIWGFIPKEWVSFFVPITGYSGFYTLLVTLGTYLFSKEIYVCDHEYYNGLSLIILCIYAVKTQGPKLAKYLDKEIDNYERDLNKWKEKEKQNLRDAIVSAVKDQECMEGQQILIAAKRENVHLQREAEFRKRQMEVYENVTRILNYHVESENVRRSVQQKNLIQWVIKEVEKSLTPQLKEEYMKLCMADIKDILKRNPK
ncbi:ATP synthase subunit b, mitochondrial-like [Coccinella septempunctata]|uniref:ATP synthase subunit b, mitochondrial-like n=1 Tax=Coccinella septempunctata TaxID=41139 RepID=UPI001D088DDC|nr:ATP synthase subunit b, mitochondrial-like [Coccinella septempunctata]